MILTNFQLTWPQSVHTLGTFDYILKGGLPKIYVIGPFKMNTEMKSAEVEGKEEERLYS